MKFYITFGQGIVHKVDGKILDKDCVVEVEYPNEEVARDEVFDLFEGKWSMIHRDCPDLKFYPRGIIKL